MKLTKQEWETLNCAIAAAETAVQLKMIENEKLAENIESARNLLTCSHWDVPDEMDAYNIGFAEGQENGREREREEKEQE